MNLRRVLLIAVAVVPLLAPVASHAAASWHSVDATAPAGVRFADVATATSAGSSVVVVVGKNGDDGVIYRLSAGGWKADAVPAQTGALTHVAFAGGAAYALGPGTLLRLASADDPASATWAAVADLPAGPLTALALAPDGTSGFLGTADGHLYTFTPGTAGFTKINEVNGQITPPSGGVSGLTSTAPGTGYAVTLGASPNPRFFGLTPSQLPEPQAWVVPADGASCSDLRGVAASADTAVAIDDACWWSFDNGAWQRHAPLAPDAVLDDVAVAGTGDGAVTAVTGTTGGAGAVWRRAGRGSFAVDAAVAPGALHGVAVAGFDDIWAVGDGGAVRHLFADPPPEDGGGSGSSTGGDDGGSAGGDSGTGTDAGTGADDGASDGAGTSGTDSGSGSGTAGDHPRTPSNLQIDVDDGSRAQSSGNGPEYSTTGIDTGTSGTSRKPGGRKPATTMRLMRGVKVRAVKGGLVIDFVLAARAKVAVVALRGKQNVGATAPKMFKPGHGRIVVHYRGAKPPTNLKITARRSGKAGTPARP
jgi:hypothetical protein